jgi:hypothetical protein
MRWCVFAILVCALVSTATVVGAPVSRDTSGRSDKGARNADTIPRVKRWSCCKDGNGNRVCGAMCPDGKFMPRVDNYETLTVCTISLSIPCVVPPWF